MKTIVVTGTKGKTTIVHIIDFILRSLGNETLRVDSNGSYINGKPDTTYEDSIKVIGKSPNVKPGRYIYGATKTGTLDKKKAVAVLEAGIACKKWGTGVPKGHDIGILTNIFSDHIDYKKIKNRKDILERKSFSFFETKKNGHFLFNADDDLLYDFILKNKNPDLTIIPLSERSSRIEEIKKAGIEVDDYALIDEDKIHIRCNEKTYEYERGIFPYSFGGRFTPMIFNYGFSIISSILISKPKNIDTKIIRNILKKYKIPLEYGRYINFSVSGKEVIIDYAHEIESLRNLVEMFIDKDITLVTRIAPDRVDKFVLDFADALSSLKIKKLIIYDKVDGISLKKYVGRTIVRNKGESSKMIFNRLTERNPKFKFEVILNEQEALIKAIKKAKQGNVVIHIQSNIEDDLEVLKKEFGISL